MGTKAWFHKEDLGLLKYFTVILPFFLFSQMIGMFIASRALPIISQTHVENLSATNFLISFAIAVAFIFLAMRHVKVIKGVVYLALFSGIFFVFSWIFPLIPAILISIALIIVREKFGNMIIHNLVLSIAIGGIGSYFGILISLEEAILIILILSIYDIFAVKSGYMVKFAKKLTEKRVPISFLFGDVSIKNLSISNVEWDKGKKKIFILGGGDVAFPTMINASAFIAVGLKASILVVVFSTLGLFLNHLIVVKKRQAIPALPLITLGCLIGIILSI